LSITPAEASFDDVGEVTSPFLRKIIGRRGIADDHVTSLMIVERYRRRPEPSNPIVALMLAAIHKELPLEAAIVSREADRGRALTEQEVEGEIERLKAEAQVARRCQTSEGQSGKGVP
jgi:hypothetical protein